MQGWFGHAEDAELGRVGPTADDQTGSLEAGDQLAVVAGSLISQQPRDLPLLPFAGSPDLVETGQAPPFEMEPDPKALLDALVPNALEFLIYTALLDSQAGFYAAQMTAMESATRNTADLISSLTLQFNRARQAAITKELVEIVSGAEALK